jgi:ribosomal protein S18
MTINTKNYFKVTEGIDWSKMPDDLRQSHEELIAEASQDDWQQYKDDAVIKRVVDLYFDVLGQELKTTRTSEAKKGKSTGKTKASTQRKPRAKKTSGEHKPAKSVKAAKVKTGKAVEHIENDIRFIQRYVAMHGKIKKREQILALLHGLQKAIVERRITKDSPYAAEIKVMEQSLKDCVDAMGASIEITIAQDKLERYQQIAASEHVSDSVGILKAYISLNGKSGVKEKAEKLLAKIEKALEDGQVKDTDRHYQAVLDAQKSLNAYLNHDKPAMHISQFELNGLAGIGTIKRPGRPPGKKKALPVSGGIDRYDLLEIHMRAKRQMHSNGLGSVVELPPVVSRTSTAPVYSGSQIMNMHFDTIGLQGRFRALLGDPSPGFRAMIFGKPKQGKSTVAIMFAKELAKLGKVKYCALEEGISPTLKDKIARMGAGVPNLDFSNEVGDVSGYKFVFIDSVSEAKMNADQVKQLCREYPKVCFILVFHATKGGDFRGGQQFAHDVDIIMRVDAGVVYVQGRFAPPAEMDMNEVIKKAA